MFSLRKRDTAPQEKLDRQAPDSRVACNDYTQLQEWAASQGPRRAAQALTL